jgi:hypothetical protein
MTDSNTVAEEQPHVTAPEPAAAPAAEQSIDDLIGEYERANATPETTEQQAPDNELDQFIASLDGSADRQKIEELTGQVDALQTEAHRVRELEAFKSFADDVQGQMPSWAPPDYAEMKLCSLAHDPVISAAWDLRNVDRKAASVELAKVTQAFLQLQQDPAADQKRLQELRDYGTRLEIAIQSPAILRKARLDILNEAKKLPPPIDSEVSAWRAEIAQSMRGASMPLDFKEPAPNFAGMSDAEFRDFTRRNYGF